jgi:hypothetical protein
MALNNAEPTLSFGLILSLSKDEAAAPQRRI